MINTILLSLILAATPKFVTYEQFGAKGDGVTDDSQAIYDAHAAANKSGRPVKADDGKTYLILNPQKPAKIQTDVYWGDATFIIDDVNCENPEAKLFVVSSYEKKIKLSGLERLRKGSRNLGLKLPSKCLVEVKNDEQRVYIRKGSNANNGGPQKEYLVVYPDGTIRKDTPVIWNYDNITSVTAFPIDNKVLTIRGGHFITRANVVDSPNYYNRNITISRSNVRIVGLTHKIEGEVEVGAPYHGFLTVSTCADVVLDSLILSGHKTYYKIGKLGRPSAKGSYDLSCTNAVGIKVINCSQFTDLDDVSKWGIMGSNTCKNISYENCRLSRFDAHQGVCGATILNSVVRQINAIGFGTFLVENSEIRSNQLMRLRGDYGSSWEGNFVIRNCKMTVPEGSDEVTIIYGYNSMDHYFGYDCTMPEHIEISGLTIDDSAMPGDYPGPRVFTEFKKGSNAIPGYHYPATKTVTIKGLTVVSGKQLTVSDNKQGFFDNTKIVTNK